MVFSCYSYKFLAVPKFWAIFFLHPTSTSQPVSQENPGHQAHPNDSLHIHLSSWILNFTCLNFLVQFMSLSRSCDQFLIISLSDSLTAFRKRCHWWNGCQRRVILEACKVAMFFRRTVSRFGQHNSKFFCKGRSYFFDGFWQYSLRSIQKRLFQDFIDFLWACARNLDLFSDKSLLLGNQLIPFERSTWFLPILMVFRLFKDSYQSQ